MPTDPPRPRLLVLRALGLGDLLAGVPALRAVRRAFPGHEIVLAAPPALEEPALATGAVDRLLPAHAPGRAVPVLRHWTGDPPELAIDLHGNGPASRDALAELRPRRLWAFAAPRTGRQAPPDWRSEEHERHRWCRFLRAYGVPADPADLRLPSPATPSPATPSPAPGAVVVHPGADSPARRWPADRYATVARRLRAAGHRVVLAGGPGEEPLLRRVAHGARLPARDTFPGGLPFAELSALIAGAALFLSGDTGPAHLAVAHGTPSVTLYGPVPPRLWGPPPSDQRHTALWHPGPPGDPHAAEPDPLLLRITAEEVLAAAAGRTEPPATALVPRAEGSRPEPARTENRSGGGSRAG
ncbi:glycosyltransferase family 9 protein [Streptomyces sp. TP-A0874]|uniref:glycosyltransferase family 9 protein n=1 Tax=Streptomyces sp. TP-A0874 TaxID=549819 RepID=UPI000AE4EA7A|nr:glycosyltransferase family 9 protein [Streptomyces sp. TP-A0874]